MRERFRPIRWIQPTIFSGVFAVNTLGGEKHVRNLNSLLGFLFLDFSNNVLKREAIKNQVCTMTFMCIMSCNMICTGIRFIGPTFGYVMGGRFGEGFPT